MKKHFIRNRKVRYGGITAILTVLIITVSVLTNAVFDTLATRYQWYTNLIPKASYGVTEDCFTFLGKLEQKYADAKVEIIFCDTADNLVTNEMQRYLYESATSMAERYPDMLTVTCHDIWTNPNTVRAYATTTDITTGETVEATIKSTSVILVSEGYHRVYTIHDFFVFKDGNTTSPWAFDGEKKLAAGIMNAIDHNAPKVCLTTNHGEVYYDYELMYLLDDAGYTIDQIDLYKDPIPADCTLILSYNPNSDLVCDDVSSVSEFDILDEFLAKEGNTFLVLLENGTPSLPNMERYLEEWGVKCGYTTPKTEGGKSYRYMVQDASQSLTSDGYTIYGEPISTGHSAEILESLERKVVFKNATALMPAQGFLNNGDGSYTNVEGNRTMYSLYQSGDNAVSWANGEAVSAEKVTLMSLSEQTVAGGSSYVGVIASANFPTEEFLQSAVYGNADLLLRLFHTVGKENTPEGLTIKPFSSQDISMITTSQMLWWTVGLAATPAIVILAIALVVLVKRYRA